MSEQKTVKIFTMEQEFPCGEQSSCCGPIGQSAEEIDNLKSSIKKELGCEVEVLNVENDDDMKDHPRIVQLFQSLGPTPCQSSRWKMRLFLWEMPHPKKQFPQFGKIQKR